MSVLPSAPILIVGAGPAGLAATLGLARAGRDVRIIDHHAKRSAHSRAIGINSRTLGLLDSFGVSAELVAAGQRVGALNVHLGERRLKLNYRKLPVKHNFLLTLHQSETERLMEQALNGYGVQVERGRTLTQLEVVGGQASGVIGSVTESAAGAEAFSTPHLIAADGVRSFVRQALGIPFVGHTLPGQWALADVRLDWEYGHEEAQVFTRRGGALLAFCYGNGLHHILATSPDLLSELPEGTRVLEVLGQSTFEVQHRVAAQRSSGPVMLIGDAAHAQSPVGSCGMNHGIEDGLSAAHSLITRTEEQSSRQRWARGQRTVKLTELQTRLLSTTSAAAQTARNFCLPLALGLPKVDAWLLHELSGLGQNTAPSPRPAVTPRLGWL